MDRIGVPGESEDLGAEGVQPVSAGRLRSQNLLDLVGVLAAADAAYSDHRQRSELDAMPFIGVSAAVVC
ncbi:hypothetical protein GCM10011609_76620 [Lentzea pudingi]|uniref:Uncharacterized protein n=1 Tax=Lentzea pudingi TaxID=1789439 RepID=A0ABQ2ISN3_9PSEU|nr:hypothetical protein GCM10011609_76620 [Lentzea pudingi]